MTPRPTRRRFLKIVAAHSAALLCGPRLLASQPSSPLTPLRWQGIVLGAEASIEIHSKNSSENTKSILHHCVYEIQRLESIFTLYDERSSLRKLNAQGFLDNPPQELAALIRYAHTTSLKTDGVFDITIHPVVEKTRLHFQSGGLAENLDLTEALSLVDYRQVFLSDKKLTLARPHAAITLNGIAQGFITDHIAQILKTHGIEHTLIDLGEKCALGRHPENRPWTLGLASADNPSQLFDTVDLANQALASSGGYGTPFDTTGKYHHLIDPRSGRSVNNHRAVHVIAPTATEADALSTTLATCRTEETDTILRQFPDARTIFQT